ncbi:MAG: hypothetical protein ABGW69_00960 [Nanoarchaeota archaeon]
MNEIILSFIEELLIGKYSFLLLIVLLVLTFLDQIPPFIFLIPLFAIYSAIVYLLIKLKLINIVITLPFLFAFASFLGDLFYIYFMKYPKMNKVAEFIENHSPFKIDEEKTKGLTIQKIFLARLSPFYKIFVYEKNREEFFRIKNIYFLYFSHLFFFYLITSIIFLSVYTAKLLYFQRFDIIFTIISLYLFFKIVKFK